MTLCPHCNEGLLTMYAIDIGMQRFSCETLVCIDGALQSQPCRIRQLERLLADVLPLAKRVSCRHGWDQVSAMNECCDWARAVERIEAALTSVNSKEAAKR